MTRFIYVGTETRTEGNGHRPDGIFVLHMDPETGDLQQVQAVESGENPSFLALHPSKRFLFAVNELRDGRVTSFSVQEETGALSKINETGLRGNGPCYISVYPSGTWAFVANYGGGQLSVVKIHEDGAVEQGLDNVKHQGHGDNPRRQDGPHAHSILTAPGDKYVLACDLGTNKVYVYRFEPQYGVLATHESYVAAPGAGPRHLAFHPANPFLYVSNELSNTVTVARWFPKDGKMEILERLPTLPEDFKDENLVADIHLTPDGRYLYVSNRGHDSLAVFRVDGQGEALSCIGWVPTEGNWPRNFTIDPEGHFLYVANERSGNLSLFEIDADTGMPHFTGKKTPLPHPQFVMIADL